MHKHLSLKIKKFKPSSESEDISGDAVCPVEKGICVLSLMGFFIAFSCAARTLACCFIPSSNSFVRSLMFLLYRVPLAFFRCVSEFRLKQTIVKLFILKVYNNFTYRLKILYSLKRIRWPRFSERPLHDRSLKNLCFWLLVLMHLSSAMHEILK